MTNQSKLCTRVCLGVTLTACAGFVDAIGYIGLGGLFASFMSGASVSLGTGLGSGEHGPIYQGLAMVASFLFGVVVGTVVSGSFGRDSLPAVLLAESLLLAGAVALTWQGWETPIAILPVVAAMGVQNTILEPASGIRLGATFITGTLVSLGRGLGQAMLGSAKPWQSAGHAMLWCGLVAGATLGALSHADLGANALLVPAGLIALLAVLSAIAILPSPKPTAASKQAPPRHYLDLQRPFIGPYY
jgi:uncharacterized membrane protein YoaK (UPF0700 family)